MAGRWRGMLGRPDARDALDRYCIQGFLSRFSRHVSGFPLTYHIELIDEVSIFSVGGEEKRYCLVLSKITKPPT